MSKPSVRLVSSGSYAPEQVLTNKDLEQRMDTDDAWIQRTYGIRERRVAASDEHVSDLSVRSAQEALQAAELGPEDVDLIVHASINNDMRVPATACIVQGRLGAERAVAFDINLGGCPNTAFALATAAQFLDGRRFRRALVICTEIYSKFINWEYRNSSCFLGDGSGAVVLEAVPGATTGETVREVPFAWTLHTDGSQYREVVWPGGGTVEAPVEAQTPVINGRAVWDFGHKVVPDAVREVTADAGMTVDALDFVVFHQANVNMIHNNMETLGIAPERTHINNDRYGNTGGASSLLALDEAIRGGKVSPGDTLVLCSYGAGLAWGAVLMRYLPDRGEGEG